MWIWWTIPAFIGLIGVMLTIGGLGRLLRLRVITGSLRFLFGGVTLGAAAVVALIGLNLQTYARLTHERAAAEVTLTRTGEQAFTASLRKANAEGVYGPAESYAVTGDAFRLEARILKWKPWANITGVDSLYRLERIQGRFDTVEQENISQPKAFDIGDSTGIDLFELARTRGSSLNAVDAYYGDGVFVPMADGAVYEVSISQSGLIPRPKNAIAEEAVRAWSADKAVGAAFKPGGNELPIQAPPRDPQN